MWRPIFFLIAYCLLGFKLGNQLCALAESLVRHAQEQKLTLLRMKGCAKTDRKSSAQHALEQSGEASEKALYVLSALVSSNHEGQHQFHSSKGVSVIRSLLSKELSTRQHRKVLNLITDLTDVDGEVEVSRRLSQFSSLWR